MKYLRQITNFSTIFSSIFRQSSDKKKEKRNTWEGGGGVGEQFSGKRYG